RRKRGFSSRFYQRFKPNCVGKRLRLKFFFLTLPVPDAVQSLFSS
ncbi:unnamed protein product, partial [Staurois parvus]